MAKAKKLKSGSWRCLVFDCTDSSGKRIYKSFTSSDPTQTGKREAEYLAAEFARSKEDRVKLQNQISFGKAFDEYIRIREPILSPRSIQSYKSIRKNYIQDLMNIDINKITQNDVQNVINIEIKTLSPKTVRDIHGIISAIINYYRPNFALNTILPKTVKPDLYIPTDEDVKRLIKAVSGTEMEVPVLLAAFGPMRRGEICALTKDCISGNTVHVHRNMVTTGNGWIIKSPKSAAGDRFIDFPEHVINKLHYYEDGRITTLTPDAISNRFSRILCNADLPHFRFHDLRHYCASIQHAIGIPDAYIMQRGGWGSDGVLKNVYRHALKDKSDIMTEKANSYFDKLV